MNSRLPASDYVAQVYGLLSEYGVSGTWDVSVVSGMGRRLGTCNWSRKRIRLSAHMLTRYDHEQIVDTLRHEVAHAIAHERHGLNIKPHGREWKAYAVLLGARPRASVPPTPEQLAAARALREARARQRSRAGTSSRGRSSQRRGRTTAPAPSGSGKSPFFVASLGREIRKGDVFLWQGDRFVVAEPKRTRFTALKNGGRMYSVPAVLLRRGTVLASNEPS